MSAVREAADSWEPHIQYPYDEVTSSRRSIGTLVINADLATNFGAGWSTSPGARSVARFMRWLLGSGRRGARAARALAGSREIGQDTRGRFRRHRLLVTLPSAPSSRHRASAAGPDQDSAGAR